MLSKPEEHTDDAESLDDLREDCGAAIAQMKYTLNDTLDFLQVESASFTHNREAVAVDDLVVRVASRCRALLPDGTELYHRSGMGENPVMEVDPLRVAQILTNGLRCVVAWTTRRSARFCRSLSSHRAMWS